MHTYYFQKKAHFAFHLTSLSLDKSGWAFSAIYWAAFPKLSQLSLPLHLNRIWWPVVYLSMACTLCNYIAQVVEMFASTIKLANREATTSSFESVFEQAPQPPLQRVGSSCFIYKYETLSIFTVKLKYIGIVFTTQICILEL